ncbi:Radical S-adenosyl methionine domain-containing protein 1, mitochondrial [Holothuria leucospilota]|uniref:Radical S-adenosyl methionine domain-containing protein 1, mitochondrial n=1 Tax=Holothuria leucospilota TaxID=206669 RepID=A0A9Q0YJY5_HOLLE|nr:Radical S-adenosyl methionine domain-containing protein 1, mitochondrial [Holothuria leucospilota]
MKRFYQILLPQQRTSSKLHEFQKENFKRYTSNSLKEAKCLNGHPNPLEEEATLYIHWPYCQKRCHYCNFNKYISQNVDHGRMRKCLVRETETLLNLSGVKKIKSIFFGGGTPSLAEPKTFAAVIDCVRAKVALEDEAEVTMEANPTSTEAALLAEFKVAGVNRLSLGVQTFNEDLLKFLGRNHSVADSLRSLEAAKNIFRGRVSIDLIFGNPTQTLDMWSTELEGALQVCDDHVSLYQLTLERGTALFKMYENGDFTQPSSDLMADMYQSAVERLSEAGFQRYEVSNFARGNSKSVHNQSYWSGAQYLGVGPGAHGRFMPLHNIYSGTRSFVREARIQTLEPDGWMCEVEKYGHGTRKITRLSKVDVLNELVLTGLRTSEGLENSNFEQLSGGVSLHEVFGDSMVVQDLDRTGFLEVTPEYLRVTDRGLIVLDSFVPDIINALNKYFAGS